MVCVPCFIIPVLLFLWHRFIQPYVLRFWNPWAVKDKDGNVKTEFPFKCEGGVCAFSKKSSAPKAVEAEEPNKLSANEAGKDLFSQATVTNIEKNKSE